MTEVTAAALATHPFLRGMSCDHLAVLAETVTHVRFPARHRLFEDGGHAARFWLIQSGYVTLDVHVPGAGRGGVETLDLGVLLVSAGLVPRYQWALRPGAAFAASAFGVPSQ